MKKLPLKGKLPPKVADAVCGAAALPLPPGEVGRRTGGPERALRTKKHPIRQSLQASTFPSMGSLLKGVLTMTLTTLIENTTLSPSLTAEHGLSLYIETGDHRILFDMGQSPAFAENARKLGIDLGKVDTAILSHGHYDHGGGLETFLSLNHTAPVYVNRHAFGPHYNASGKYIGLDLRLQNHPRLVFTQGQTHIAPGLTLHTLPLPPADTSGLQVLEEGSLRPEDFRHEQYLTIEEAGRTILISGCSHKGIVPIANHFRPDILIGGFHLMKVTDPKLLDACAQSLPANTTYFTGHCTLSAQFERLKTTLGTRLYPLQTGSVYVI